MTKWRASGQFLVLSKTVIANEGHVLGLAALHIYLTSVAHKRHEFDVDSLFLLIPHSIGKSFLSPENTCFFYHNLRDFESLQ